MDTASLQRLKDALGQNDRVAILVGKNPNIDEMAAALSLYLSLKSSQKPVTIASASQPIVELSSLVGIDEVKSSAGSSGGDLVVSFPYQEGEIEKVSYTIENGMLNIVVKAGENGLNFQEQDVRFTRGGGLPNLLVVVGTAQLASLGDLYNPETLKDASIVNIDNKTENEGFGDIVLVAPQFSSVSEQMANIILSNGLPMDVDTAQNLMLGISFATNNFQSPQTSYFAFEIVAELMRRGAVRVPGIQAPVQTPSYMQQPQHQAMSGPVQQPRQQMPRPQQGMPRQNMSQQQRGGGQQQGHGRMQQRMNQNSQQRQQNQAQNQNQNQTSRQDEIRRALAEQARSMQQANQMPPAPTNQPIPQPMAAPQMPQQPIPQPAPQPQVQPQQPQQPDMSAQTQQPQSADAPSDWLTPKVYKGSSNPS